MSGVRSPQHPPPAKANSKEFGVVVQLVRIPACHAGGRGFESRPLRQPQQGRTTRFAPFAKPRRAMLQTLPRFRQQEDRPAHLRAVPRHSVRVLRHRLLLPRARGRRHASRASAASASARQEFDNAIRQPGRDLPPAVPRPVRRLAHGQPGDPPRGARSPREREARRRRDRPRPACAWATSSSPKRIVAEPVFQVDGKFSKERYDLIAKSQGLTPVGLDERLRRDYREQQFRDSIVDDRRSCRRRRSTASSASRSRRAR